MKTISQSFIFAGIVLTLLAGVFAFSAMTADAQTTCGSCDTHSTPSTPTGGGNDNDDGGGNDYVPNPPRCTISASLDIAEVNEEYLVTWTGTPASADFWINGYKLQDANDSATYYFNGDFDYMRFTIYGENQDGSCGDEVVINKKVPGCLDIDATNYNQYATYDDGSCEYETPAPTCDMFTVSPSTIYRGESTTLTWASTNATQAFINGAVGTVDLDGTVQVSPLFSTTYVLTLTAEGHNSVQCDAPVVVEDKPVDTECELEVIKTVDKNTAVPGEDLTYTIKVKNTGDADCTGGGVKIEDVLDTSFTYESNTYTSNFSEGYGSQPVYTASDRTVRFNGHTLTPGESGTIVLFGKIATPLTCGDYKVTNQAKATAKELNNFQTYAYSSVVTTDVDYDCEVPKLPVCESFTALPGTLPAGGGNVVLDWDLLNVAMASVDNGVGEVFANVGTDYDTVSGARTVSVTQSTTFTLTAENVAGDSVSCVASVIVEETEVKPPSCDLFTAAPTEITVGDTATLSWESTDAVQAFINNAIGEVDVDGAIEVSPLVDTTYVLTLIGAEDRVIDCNVPVKVLEEVLPVCVGFSATPSALPVGGGTTTLAWEVTDATAVSIDNGVGAVDLTGTQSVSVTQSTTFTLTATDTNGNTDSCIAPVAVADPGVFSCEANVSFSASDTSLVRGQSSTLSWNVIDADSVSISQINASTLTGNQSVSPATDTTYILTAEKSGYDSISCPVVINVSTGGGGGGSPTPRCELEISDTDISLGDDVTITWDTRNATEVTLTNDEGDVLFTTDDYLSADKNQYFDYSIEVTPTKNTTYTLLAERGSRDRECEVSVELDDEITLLQVRDQAPLVSGISLTQVPYTGFEAGPVMTVLFYMLLITWALYITYVLVIPKTELAVATVKTNTGKTNTELMAVAEQVRPDVFTPMVVSAPANLPVATAPEVMPVVADIPETNTVENQAHALQALVSSDAARTIAAMTTEENQAEVVAKIVADAKGQFPLEDGWVVINQSRLAQITDTTSTEVSPSPTGAGSLAEAIVTGNVVASYEMIGTRPMIALADAAADLDAVYRMRKGADATVSDMLAQETANLTEGQIAEMIAALTGALDGTYSDEASAVKMAIMKAVKIAG